MDNKAGYNLNHPRFDRGSDVGGQSITETGAVMQHPRKSKDNFTDNKAGCNLRRLRVARGSATASKMHEVGHSL